jgi:hypothetical protein
VCAALVILSRCFWPVCRHTAAEFAQGVSFAHLKGAAVRSSTAPRRFEALHAVWRRN